MQPPSSFESPDGSASPLALFPAFAGLVILTGAIVYFRRRPHWIREQVGVRIDPLAGLLVLALWILTRMAAGVMAPRLFARFDPATLSGAAALAWIVYGLSLPAVVLWFEAVRRRRHLGSSATAPLTPSENSLNRNHGAPTPHRPLLPLWQSLLAAPLLTLLAYPVVNLVISIASLAKTIVTGDPPDPVAHQTLHMLETASWRDPAAMLLIVSVVIAAPLIEETLYRGCLQGMARSAGVGVWLATGLTALIFAMMHIEATSIETLPGLFVLGLSMGLAYEWSGRLITPVIMHALFNLSNVALLYLVHQ